MGGQEALWIACPWRLQWWTSSFQMENQRFLSKGLRRDDGHSAHPDVERTLISDIKDPTLIGLPGISQLSGNLEKFPGIWRSHFSPLHIQSVTVNLCLDYIYLCLPFHFWFLIIVCVSTLDHSVPSLFAFLPWISSLWLPATQARLYFWIHEQKNVLFLLYQVLFCGKKILGLWEMQHTIESS